MATKKGFFQKYRLVFQSSPLALKFALLITILVAVVSLSVLGGYWAKLKADYEDMRHYAAQLEQVNAKWEEKNKNQGTTQDIKDTASDELGMVDKDAIFIPVRPEAPAEIDDSPENQNFWLIIVISIAAVSLLVLGGSVVIIRTRAKNLPQE